MIDPLWLPGTRRLQEANINRFMQLIRSERDPGVRDYQDLYRFSIDSPKAFWRAIWEFGAVVGSPGDRTVEHYQRMPGAKWFEGARLNFAENLLRFRDDKTALVFWGEDREKRKITYAELYLEVARLAASLKEVGVGVGDRVAGFMPNMPEAIIAMLAATSLGATWSSCSPDFGIKGVLDRFGQIKPKVLFAANGYWFKGNNMDSLGRVSDILKELPDIAKVVVVPYTESGADIGSIPNAVHYKDFISSEDAPEIEFQFQSDYEEGYVNAIAHFVDCLRSGKPFETPISDNLETLRLVEDAYAAAA